MIILALLIGFIIGIYLQKRSSIYYVKRYRKDVFKTPSTLSDDEKNWVLKSIDDLIEVIKGH